MIKNAAFLPVQIFEKTPVVQLSVAIVRRWWFFYVPKKLLRHLYKLIVVLSSVPSTCPGFHLVHPCSTPTYGT